MTPPAASAAHQQQQRQRGRLLGERRLLHGRAVAHLHADAQGGEPIQQGRAAGAADRPDLVGGRPGQDRRG
jgi:hypothetical protein